MDAFFETLKRVGIKNMADVPRVLSGWKLEKIVELAVNSYVLINKAAVGASSRGNIFDFSVNGAISGGERPCAEIPCRLKRAVELANFSALYANTVFIPPFFDYIEHSDFNFPNDDHIQFFYNRVVGDLILLFFYKPLIDAGIIKINSRGAVFCEQHLQQARKQRNLLYKKLNRIEGKISEHIAKKIRFELDETSALIISPPEYAGTEVLRFAILPREFKKYKLPHTFNRTEVKKMKLVENAVLTNAIDNLVLQKYSLRVSNLNYLTNLEMEADIINILDQKNKTRNTDLVKNLTHELPFVAGVSIKEILKVRRAEAEHFENYREALQAAIKSTQNAKNQNEVKLAVRDLVLPEVHKIQKIIKTNRSYFLKKAGNKILFDSVLISGGIFANRMFGIDFSQLFKQYGLGDAAGIYAGKEIYDDLVSAAQTPQEALNNDFYFLWKLKR